MAIAYQDYAPNVRGWNLEGAINRGLVKIKGGGQSRSVTLKWDPSSYMLRGVYFTTAVSDQLRNASYFRYKFDDITDGPNLATLTVPAEAVRWCISTDENTMVFQECQYGFGGTHSSAGNAFRLVWYDGETWHNDWAGDYLTAGPGGGTRVVNYGLYMLGDVEGRFDYNLGYAWGATGYNAAWKPYVADPDYGYYSGAYFTPLVGTINGAPFIPDMDKAVHYVETGELPDDNPVDPDFGPPSTPEGYDGYVAPTGGDDIGLPSTPPSALGSGLIHLYKADNGSLQQLGRELFPRISWPQPGQDLLEWIGDLIMAFSDSVWNKDLIDYIISIHLVPCPLPNTSLEDIVVGPRTMNGILARPQSSEYVDYDFGSINVDAVYKNFGDYLTNVRLFLPFYGFVPINIQDCMGGSISVKYRFNIIDGSFMAYVSVTSNKSHKNNSLIGQYGGSAVIHLPLTGSNYANMFSNVIGSGAGAAAGIATGNLGVAATSAIGIASSLGGGGGREGNNSYNASSAIMSRRKPFISVERVVSSFSTAYIAEKGMPSNIDYTLGECHGFTKVMNPILDGIVGATDKDIAELRRLLREGVYF